MGCPFFLSDSWTAGSDAAVVAVLTPCLKDGDGNGIAQVEAAVLRPHRQADALRLGEGVADAFGKAGAFAAETNQSPGVKLESANGCEPCVVMAYMQETSGCSDSRNASHDSWMRIVAYS